MMTTIGLVTIWSTVFEATLQCYIAMEHSVQADRGLEKAPDLTHAHVTRRSGPGHKGMQLH